MTTKQSIQWWQIVIIMVAVGACIAFCDNTRADAQGYAPPTTTQVGATGTTGAAGANGVGDTGTVGNVAWAPVDNPTDTATVTIGGVIYEFDDNASVTEGRTSVTIGGNLGATLDALVIAVNAGAANVVASNIADTYLFVFRAATPGGALAIGTAPAVATSEVADVWSTLNAGRAANRSQASGRVVLDDVTASAAFGVYTTFSPTLVSCSFFTSAGAPKPSSATCEIDTSTTPDTLSIDPTAGGTPLAATDIVVYTVWE